MTTPTERIHAPCPCTNCVCARHSVTPDELEIDRLRAELREYVALADGWRKASSYRAQDLAAVEAVRDQLRTEVARLREELERAAKALEVAADCLNSPNPAVTDTLWLNPDPNACGPTLYEHLLSAAIRARSK